MRHLETYLVKASKELLDPLVHLLLLETTSSAVETNTLEGGDSGGDLKGRGGGERSPDDGGTGSSDGSTRGGGGGAEDGGAEHFDYCFRFASAKSCIKVPEVAELGCGRRSSSGVVNGVWWIVEVDLVAEAGKHRKG